MRAAFLSERTANCDQSPEPDHDPDVLDYSAQIVSQLKAGDPGLLSEIHEEIHRRVSNAPTVEWLTQMDWPVFFATAHRYAKDPFVIFGLDVTSQAQKIPFGPAIAPLVACGIDTYLHCGDAYGANDAVARALAAQLFSDVAEICCFTLYVEMSERFGVSFSDLSKKENAEKYRSFCAEIAGNGWQPVVEKYPVLGRLVHQRIQNTLAAFVTFTERLRNDLPCLAEKFDLNGAAQDGSLPVEDIALGLSDYHQGGQSVYRLTFPGGARIFYKPKPIENERWFYEHLSPFLRENGIQFPDLAVLARDDYGWVQDVDTCGAFTRGKSDLDSETQIGHAIGVAYLLNATDLHCENVRIRNGQVAFLDLETLFHCRMASDDESSPHSDTIGLSSVESGLVRESASADRAAEEPTGLFNAVVPQVFPFPRFEVGQEGELSLSQPTIPSAQSAEKECFDVASIDPGRVGHRFEKTVSDLCGSMGLQSVLSAAGSTITRHVVRPTAFYARLGYRVLQPRFLTDGRLFSLELYKLFDDCLQLDFPQSHYVRSVIKNEISQIERGDVPLFFVRFESAALETHDHVVVETYFQDAPKTTVQKKISAMNVVRLNEDRKLLETTLSVAQSLSGTQRPETTISENLKLPDLSTMILDKTEELVGWLVASAFEGARGHSSWITYSGAVDGKRVYPQSKDPTLYGGYLGIFAFLDIAVRTLEKNGRDVDSAKSFLSREAGELERAATADAQGLHAFLPRGGEVGLSGAGGVFAAAALTENRGVNSLAPLVHWVLREGRTTLSSAITSDVSTDVINGCAGLLIGAAKLLDMQPRWLTASDRNALTELAISAFSYLVHLPDGHLEAPPWIQNMHMEPSLGFAHGAIGYATGLAVGANLASPKSKRQTAVANKFEFVDSYLAAHQDPLSKSWLDPRRSSAKGARVNASWCHGLSGIGLGAMISARLNYPIAPVLDDAAGQLVDSERASVDCFCCGEAGVIDFLNLYGKHHNEKAFLDSAEQRMFDLFSDWRRTDQFRGMWGATHLRHFPGLFQGATGIAYVGLRYLDPTLPHMVACTLDA